MTNNLQAHKQLAHVYFISSAIPNIRQGEGAQKSQHEQQTR
jgi:hypothetical protein